MTITLCNSHPFTFYLPFHTSLRADQCPIQSHVPSTCTLGLDPCARHSLFGRTDPYYIDNFYSSCGLKRLAATLASPFSVIVLSSQYLFQRGPIWILSLLHCFVVAAALQSNPVVFQLGEHCSNPSETSPVTASLFLWHLLLTHVSLFQYFSGES